MPVGPQTTSNLSDSVRTLYGNKYIEGAMPERLYDQFAHPVGQDGVETAARMGATITVPFASSLPPSIATISQTTDIVPKALRDATASITTTSLADAIEWAEATDIQTYTDYGAARHKAIGKQQMMSVEHQAKTAALAGLLFYRAAARASLDAGTAGHRLTDTIVSMIADTLASLDVPQFDYGLGPQWALLMHSAAFHDLRAGGNVVNVGVYQDKAIILNFELGQIGPFKVVATGKAHVFGAAGVNNASAVTTTIAASLGGSANQALGTTIEVASASNIVAGMWLTLGTEETAGTLYPTNERVKVGGVSSTTITVIGGGDNGGLKYDHQIGEIVHNSDSVYPVLAGSPMSLAKAFDAPTGEFGTVVGPKISGVVDQFGTLGWKWYGGYGRWRENTLHRTEVASSLEA